MRGRRRGLGLGNYTLGDRYITPDRRLSQSLIRQGSRGGPSNSWQETMGRIAQQLAGAYIGYKDQQNRNVANQAFAKVEPDSLRPPTDAEAMATPGMRDLELSAMTGIAGDGQGQTVTAPLPDDQLMGQGNIPDIMEKIGRYNQNMGKPGALGDEILQQGLDLQTQKFNQEMNQSKEASNVPRPRDFKAELAQGMQGYQQDPSNRVMNEKKPQLEYAMQNLRGLENNPYAQRLLQGLMMNQMTTDAASRLDATARERQLADATTAYDRKKELGQMPMSPEQFEQKQSLVKPARPKTVKMAEGVFVLNDDGSLGARLGSPAKEFVSQLDQAKLNKLEREKTAEVKEIKSARIKDRDALTAFKRKNKMLDETIKRAMSNINWASTGATGLFSSVMPFETDRSNLDSDLLTLKANLGFDSLQQMRDNSKTGGALGNVSENENLLLQAINGALEPKNRDQLVENLGRIKALYPQVLAEKEQTYKSVYGEAYDTQKKGKDGGGEGQNRRKTDSKNDPLGLRQ